MILQLHKSWTMSMNTIPRGTGPFSGERHPRMNTLLRFTGDGAPPLGNRSLTWSSSEPMRFITNAGAGRRTHLIQRARKRGRKARRGGEVLHGFQAPQAQCSLQRAPRAYRQGQVQVAALHREPRPVIARRPRQRIHLITPPHLFNAVPSYWQPAQGCHLCVGAVCILSLQCKIAATTTEMLVPISLASGCVRGKRQVDAQ